MIIRDIKNNSLLESANNIFGYKVMNYDPQTGQVMSGADNRVTKGMKLAKGMTMSMPAPGIFMSTNRDYVEAYYGGHNDHEVLIKFEFDPSKITTGNLTDVENEFTILSAKVVGFKIINNLEESTIVTELFNEKYDWQWSMNGDNTKMATFTVDGSTVEVYFVAASHKSPNWETGFKKGGTIKRTGEGDQFRIFATVIDIIETFMLENKEAHSLTFVAKREGAAAEDPKLRDSRAELYKRMIGRFAKKHNFEFIWDEVGRMTEFMLRRNAMQTESSAPTDLQTLATSLKTQYNLKDIWLSDLGNRNAFELSNIIVSKDNQKAGIGTAVMTDIVNYADNHGKIVVLNPALKDKQHGTTSQSRLRKFYKRFGFIDNKGSKKNFEFRHIMIRYPKNKIDENTVTGIIKKIKIKDLTVSDSGMAIASNAAGGAKTNAPLTVAQLPTGYVYLVNGYHRLVDAQKAGKDAVTVEFVPFEKIKILWDNERPEHIVYGKKFKNFEIRETMIRYPKSSKITESKNNDESYQLQLIRDGDEDVLIVTTNSSPKWVEIRGKQNYETSGYDPEDRLHIFLDKLDPATVSALMAGDTKFLNPNNSRTTPSIVQAKHVMKTKDINESFDSPKSIKWVAPSVAQAVMPDSTILRVTFDELSPKKYYIEFYRDEDATITGGGLQMQVFATVLAAIADFTKRFEPVEYSFFSEKGDSPNNQRGSRPKLYRRLIDKFAPKIGMYLIVNDHSDYVHYVLRKKPKKMKTTESTEIKQQIPLSQYNQDRGNFDHVVIGIENKIEKSNGDLSRFVKMVPIAALTTTQSWLDDHGGGDPVFPDIDEDYEDYPVTALIGNELLLLDGNHRINRLIRSKKTHVEVLVFPFKINESIKKPHPKDTLGIKRADMPQVHRDHYPELLDYLTSHGGNFKNSTVHASELKPVQSEFSDAGVEKMMQKKGVTSDGKDKKPLIVSSDYYIIDGHHRWLAAYNMDETVPIMQISLPVKKLFQLVKDFKHTTYKDIHEEATLQPGTDAWFKHWFSRPKLTRDEVDHLKEEAVNFIKKSKGVRNEKTSTDRRSNRDRRSNERGGT